jgi:hypothetical protein
MSRCPDCGRQRSEHNRHVRFTLPDPVIRSGVDVGAEGFWMSHETPRESVFLSVHSVGSFLRALVPVQLTGGYTVTFGAWVGVPPEEAKHAFDVWWTPAYSSLDIEGRLANALPGWDVFGAPVRLVVRNVEETPYCDSSTDEVMAGVLSDVWSHDAVLASLPE